MTRYRQQVFALTLFLWLPFCATSVLTAKADNKISFTRDVRPILAENCFQCHGPDENKREAELRLDIRAETLADLDSGTAAIAPGKPDESGVIERITSGDEDERMPPPDTGKHLSPRQIETLRRWIADGAEYELHWSFAPLERPDLPPVQDAGWLRNPIDRFVLAKIERNGIAPSPAADRYTLARRLYLDLLGLPPTVAEVDAFVTDVRPDAYERLLDRVLASPRFGERWGRHWLDQARYADSHGYTNDNARTMWPYRDWVIDAFNRDLPFDQFTTEQLAGDLLPDARIDQLVATGFHRNTLINSEGGTKADQFRDEQVKDRVDTTGTVWLGLTVGCAKCHSHKYDPITQTEYYQLYAFFNSTADRNSITPTIKAPSLQQRAELQQLDARRAVLKGNIENDSGRTSRQATWEQSLVAEANQATGDDGASANKTKWTVLELSGKSKHDADFEKLEDSSLLVSGSNVTSDEYQLTARPTLKTIRSVRLEALTHDKLPKRGPGRAGNGNFVLSEFWFRTGDGRELRFSKAAADHSQPNYEVAGAIDGDSKTGWAINGSPEGGANHDRVAWFVLPAPLEVGENEALTFTMQFNQGSSPYNLGRLRLSIAESEWIDAPSVGELAKLASVPADQRSKSQQQRLDDAFLKTDLTLGPIYSELQSVEKQREMLSTQTPTTMVLRELDSPRATHVQIRGDFLRPGDPVDANVPAVLLPLRVTDSSGESDSADTASQSLSNRLNFARWLTRPDHPLTPRVRMNRIWMRLFGVGLVETENDFGIQGTLPTHPELLDWLATEFVRQQWSTKRMLRMIANSATYRQSSHVRPSVEQIDPRNELLARQNRVRVEGEIVRDLGLAVSGLLSDKIGGPSVYPPQPDGVYAFTQRAKNWRVSGGEDRYRRGMYTFFYRSAPYPMLTTFDAPKFNQTCTQRARSDTPLQSLTVANDEAMFEMTRGLARRVLLESAQHDGQQQLARMFRICFARPPLPAERDFLIRFLSSQREHFAADAEAAKAVATTMPETLPAEEAAAWVATARVLLNLDEFITRE